MTERLADIEARLASITELQDVVGAMRSIAAVRLQQAAGSLAGTRAYAEVVTGALARAVALLPEARTDGGRGDGRGNGVVLFCPEHGFTGAFTERLVDTVLSEPDPPPVLLVVGSRGAALLEERGRAPAWYLPMATQPAAVPTTARHVADALLDRVGSGTGKLTRVDMVYGCHHGGGPPSVERRALLPVDIDRFRRFSTRDGAADQPAAGAAGRASGRGIRACRTGPRGNGERRGRKRRPPRHHAVARQNIAQTLETLQSAERRIRQEQITAELLELVTGTEALNGT